MKHAPLTSSYIHNKVSVFNKYREENDDKNFKNDNQLHRKKYYPTEQ